MELSESATYYTYSPEDVDQNGFLDNWGEKNLGYGFQVNTNTPKQLLQARWSLPDRSLAIMWIARAITQSTGALLTGITDQVGMANPVSGARHVLKTYRWRHERKEVSAIFQ